MAFNVGVHVHPTLFVSYVENGTYPFNSPAYQYDKQKMEANIASMANQTLNLLNERLQDLGVGKDYTGTEWNEDYLVSKCGCFGFMVSGEYSAQEIYFVRQPKSEWQFLLAVTHHLDSKLVFSMKEIEPSEDEKRLWVKEFMDTIGIQRIVRLSKEYREAKKVYS